MKQINWNQFLTVTVCSTVIYYIVIALLYYRREIKWFLFKKSDTAIPAIIKNPENEMPKLMQDAIAAVKQIIQQAVYARSPKEKIVFDLQGLFGSSPNTSLKESPFLLAINELIASECLMHCSIQLSENDYVQLWNKQ